MTKRQVIYSMLLTVLSVFCLALFWEFWLEPALEPGEFESESNADRWDFIVTSAAFAAIALIVPSLISLRNIAGRARAEAALRRAKELAETASRTKSRFLATMSHELRTPLNAIIGFSEIMLSELYGPLENERYREYNKDIHESAGHLLALINDILELSKAEAGKLELQEGVVDLGSLVESSVRLIRQKAVCGEVAIEIEIATAAVRLRGDERKLKQVLLNLLSNAVKFTPPGGRVEVRVACDRAGSLVIGVRDTGIGIAEADLPEALEPFGQAGNRAGQSDEGTGLGLPLARAMIELHGGSLTIDSVLGVGTTVTVVIPSERVLDRARSVA
ncbi:MAG: HAMP domain-containing histidine kinase [Proteobacteria bacterium]|nr:HAMP domain-containing histidine kinase [Pseudomonadota bacterium]